MEPKILFRGTTKSDLESSLFHSTQITQIKLNFTTDMTYALGCAWQYASDNNDKPRLIILEDLSKFSFMQDKTTSEWYFIDLPIKSLSTYQQNVKILTENNIHESARYYVQFFGYPKEIGAQIKRDLKKRFAKFL